MFDGIHKTVLHTMQILSLNCGSSSVKADVVDTTSGKRLATLRIERLGGEATYRLNDGSEQPLEKNDHAGALAATLPKLLEGLSPEAVGHRVVHGGRTKDPLLLDQQAEDLIEQYTPLAPLHNPANLAGIRAAKQLLPSLPHIAVFDTAFHANMPKRARGFALPHALAEKHGIERYGFHGTSHQFVARRAASYLQADIRQLCIITCHLGNGASIAAVEFGRSVETSMGLTPLEGLVMGTRSGDVDPGALITLMKNEGLSAEELDVLLNKESGLKGLSGVGNDLRDIEAKAAEGDANCQHAIHVFTHRLTKYIGAYAAVMGGADAIVFTAGIGQNSATVRDQASQKLGYLGAFIDHEANRNAKLTDAQPVVDISQAHSRCKLLVIATDEQLAIAQQCEKLLAQLAAKEEKELPPIPVGVSGRHAHLTQEAIDVLFGKGYQLKERKPLSQPGQFAAEETISVVGPKNTLERVRILGPVRSKNQIEVSRTDEFFLGIDAPVRESGHVEGSPGVKIIGPVGELDLKEGLICAWRHIHMTSADAKLFGVQDRDIVDVEILDEHRPLVFGNVLIRVKDSYALEMHIDTDEANAAEINTGEEALMSTNKGARLVKRRV